MCHLFADIAPKTVENFRKLCAESYRRPDGKVLTYKGSKIHRIIPDFIIQGGDVLTSYGTSSESIYGGYFEDENFVFNHDKEGLLSMANKGPNTNGSQFFITLKQCPWIDGKYTVFGEVIQGIFQYKYVNNE